MRRFANLALSIGATAVLLAGCGGSLAQNGVPGAMPQSSTITARGEHGGSWMLPEAKGEDLLYVSSQPGSGSRVYVYDYRSRRQVGTLSGFENAYGQCVDEIGDVWITDMSAKLIVEYAHGGASPLKTLDTAGNPVGCSVAPNGNLAVAEGGTGVELFGKGSSTGVAYRNHRCAFTWTPGYDSADNLYFEGKQYSRYSYKVNVCELPSGATSVRVVSFNKKITGLASVMWDGKYVTLTDATNSRRTYIYQANESSSGNLSLVGKTQLFDRTCNGTEILQPFIVGTKNTPANRTQGTHIVGGNGPLNCYHDFDAWAYPAGGHSLRALSIRFAQGESVSIAR